MSKTIRTLEKARDKSFLAGYIVCLSNVTEGGKNIATTDREAWRALGQPSAKELKHLGLSNFDLRTCAALRKECRHGR